MELNSNYPIYLDVRVHPGTRTARTHLTRDSTALNVVDQCKEILKLDADYLLVANFNGFEKQFNPQERLYHLVKKQVLSAGLDEQVQFYIRKKKKHLELSIHREDSGEANKTKPVDVTGSETPRTSSLAGENEGRFTDDQTSWISCEEFSISTTNTYDLETQQMAENRQPPSRGSFAGDALLRNVESMSDAELMQIADRQKRQIECNNAEIAAKESKLNNLRHGKQHHEIGNNAEAEAILTSRLHQLRQQIKTEEAQLQRLRRLRAEMKEVRRRSVTARFDLEGARTLLAEKEQALKETAGRVQELMRQLDAARRRRTGVTSMENERKYYFPSGKLDNGNTAGVVEISAASSSPLNPNYQRPRAAIEPFNVIPPSHPIGLAEKRIPAQAPSSAGDHLPPATSMDYLHSKGFLTAFTAMEEALQQQAPEQRCPLAVMTEAGMKSNVPSGGLNPSVTYAKLPLSGKQPAVGQGFASTGPKGNAVAEENGMLPRNGMEMQRHPPLCPTPSWAGGMRRRSDTPLPQPVIPKVNISINRRFQIANASPLLYEEMPPPDLIPASEKLKFSSFEDVTGGRGNQPPIAALGSVRSAENGSKAAPSQRPENGQPRGDADKIHLRNDTLRAAKRRSWAENHLPVTTDEAEHIRLLLTKAQQRGRSSLNLSWIFDQLTTSSGGQDFHENLGIGVVASPGGFHTSTTASAAAFHASTGASAYSVSAGQPYKPPTPPLPPMIGPEKVPIGAKITPEGSAENERANEQLPGQISKPEHEEASKMHNDDDVEMTELKHEDDEGEEESTSSAKRRCLSGDGSMASETDEEEEKSAGTVIENVSITIELKPPPAKGILRLKKKEDGECSRRVHFSPLALLLDAALEGQLDLVKSCASKLPNVSTSNEEGITALHNAICAGHYEIVRFLVEAGADVNAEDRDGWTPLHCAASCNNLPMVKFLIERGACVFATTTKDHETPADKCEKEEEGFDGCSQFLYSVQEKMGVLNGGRVYGAYDYEAEFEDELGFKADEPILIQRREDEKEKGWWWAKRESNGEEGYVPRNYLALYPRLVAQRSGAMGSANNTDVVLDSDCTLEPGAKAADENTATCDALPAEP